MIRSYSEAKECSKLIVHDSRHEEHVQVTQK